VLPVVTALLACKKGDLLIIENPESHIHPKGQVQLGRLMALAAINDIQLVVETHSDHILNGIRVGVKEGAIEKDKVRIYYFEREVQEKEQFSQVSKILIDAKGELSNYPHGFMNEWSDQLLRLL